MTEEWQGTTPCRFSADMLGASQLYIIGCISMWYVYKLCSILTNLKESFLPFRNTCFTSLSICGGNEASSSYEISFLKTFVSKLSYDVTTSDKHDYDIITFI